jgi:hypothetical protein
MFSFVYISMFYLPILVLADSILQPWRLHDAEIYTPTDPNLCPPNFCRTDGTIVNIYLEESNLIQAGSEDDGLPIYFQPANITCSAKESTRKDPEWGSSWSVSLV